MLEATKKQPVFPPGRRLPVPAMVVLVLIYLGVIQGLTLWLTRGMDVAYGHFPTPDALLRQLLVPVAASVVLVLAVVTYLGWWRPVLLESRRVGRWALLFPILIGLTAFLVTNYAQLGGTTASFVLLLALGALLVGIGEEVMYRGLALESLRRSAHTTEFTAALWTAALFGSSHLINAPTEGVAVVGQVLLAASLGLSLYLCRLVGRGLWLPVLLHALWDFGLFSSAIGPEAGQGRLIGLPLATNIVLLIVVFVRRRVLWPRAASPEAATSASGPTD